MAQIFVLSGADVGRSFEVKNGDTLGRSPDCIVTLRDPSISRRHAHLERMHNQWFVVDDKSRNGITIDGARVQRGELRDMQEFKVGELHLRFRVTAPAIEPAVPAIAAAPNPPPPPAVDEDEIVLEGADEIELAPAAARAPLKPAPAPSRALDEAPPELELGETSVQQRPAPPKPMFPKVEFPKVELKSSMLDTSFGRAPASAGATISRAKAGAGDRVLQYSKFQDRAGLANADLSQMSATKRWALYVVAILFAVVIGLFAFKGTSWIKALAGGGNAATTESDQ